MPVRDRRGAVLVSAVGGARGRGPTPDPIMLGLEREPTVGARAAPTLTRTGRSLQTAASCPPAERCLATLRCERSGQGRGQGDGTAALVDKDPGPACAAGDGFLRAWLFVNDIWGTIVSFVDKRWNAGGDLGVREHLKEALRTRRFFSDSVLTLDKTNTVVLATPVIDESGSNVAVLAGAFDMHAGRADILGSPRAMHCGRGLASRRAIPAGKRTDAPMP